MKKCIFIAVAAVCGAMASCNDILDTTPGNSIATSNMWTTENLTDQGMNGVYASLRNWGIYANAIMNTDPSAERNGKGQWCYDLLSPLAQSHYSPDFVNGGITPASANVENLWRGLYEGIHRANDAIVNIPAKSPVSDEKKGRYVAEAKFLRAFIYHRLNELWRGVPYYDVPIDVSEAVKSQETEEFIWGKIIEDLNACIAEPNLPDRDPAAGRATKGAAYALRGKVYMQQGKWAEAIADFEKVGQCGYALFQGDYKALFTSANDNSTEHVFRVENFMLRDYGSVAHKMLGSRSASGGGWADHNITPWAVDLYENADGTPFDWDDYLPGYNSMVPEQREVYFLRDTKDAGGNPAVKTVVDAVNARLASDALRPFADRYLPYGNEARLREAYDNRDPRLNKNVITPYSTYLGANHVIRTQDFLYTMRWPMIGNAAAIDDGEGGMVILGDYYQDNSNEVLYHYRKFVFEGYPGTAFNRDYGDIDDPLIRYADVLLMMAEAHIELNDLGAAQDLVKSVRDRVGMPTLAANFADQATARNYVRDERRREFLGEGGSYFDELRWGTLRDTKYKPGTRQLTVWGGTSRGGLLRWPDVLSGNEFVWPVPLAEIEKNPNLKQTQGWTY